MTAYIKKKNYSAKLPDDFGMLLSINRNGNQLLNDPQDKSFRNNYEIFKTENFYIDQRNMRIIFSGSFNKYWIIRIVQKLNEHLFPKIYEINYIHISQLT